MLNQAQIDFVAAFLVMPFWAFILWINIRIVQSRLPKFCRAYYIKFIRTLGLYTKKGSAVWTMDRVFNEEEAGVIMFWQFAAQIEMFFGGMFIFVVFRLILGWVSR